METDHLQNRVFKCRVFEITLGITQKSRVTKNTIWHGYQTDTLKISRLTEIWAVS